ncbi:hypothetical protein [Roseateles sp.]|uniref:hypothetical protein n=1 Tax=Roseateles sp. TaxID=1971397 RepID=UPI003BAC7CA0
MNHLRHALCAALLAAMLAGCAGNRPLEFAQPVALQDALPEHTAIYLVRAPHDGGVIELMLDGQPVARLPANGYTTVQVRPGQRRLTATAKGSGKDGQVDSLLEAKPGERHFYYLVQPTDVRPNLGGALVVVPKLVLFLPSYGGTPVPAGARVWQEMSEADAQGMLGISKLVMPEQMIY